MAFMSLLSLKPVRAAALCLSVALATPAAVIGGAGVMTVVATPAMAVEPDEVLADPALEARARNLSVGLRCMVCQNQSIDDSDAELAKDLRVLVRERLVAGDSDDEVIDYLVSRYGDFVLLKPRFDIETLALWGSPVIVLAAGVIFALVAARRRKAEGLAARTSSRLSTDEEKALAELMKRS